MTPHDLVFNTVYLECLKQGCDERLSRDTATQTLQKYKNNQFTKPSVLIDQSIKTAKKLIPKKRKKPNSIGINKTSNT